MSKTTTDDRVLAHELGVQVAEQAHKVACSAVRIEALAEGMDSEPGGRLEWLISIAERMAIIENDLTWCRYGRVIAPAASMSELQKVAYERGNS